jgi:hypothetical protein
MQMKRVSHFSVWLMSATLLSALLLGLSLPAQATQYTFNFSLNGLQEVPSASPATVFLLGTGLVGLGALARRRRLGFGDVGGALSGKYLPRRTVFVKIPVWLLSVLILLTGLLQVTPAAAVIIGQIDNFEDGTTQNWLVALLGASHPAPPVNIATGGPGGVDDNYLLLTALGGSGVGSRLAVINTAQWTGDYLAAGVHGILMDVNNLGNADLSLRLLVADPQGGPPTNLAFSTNAVDVPAQSGWIRVHFRLDPGDLTASLGSVTAALANTTEFRIFHSLSATFPGEAVVAQLGLDNITAVSIFPTPVPAMSEWGMLIFAVFLGLSAIYYLSRRRAVG